MHQDIAQTRRSGVLRPECLLSATTSFHLLWFSAILIPLGFFIGGAIWSWRVVRTEAQTSIERTTDILHEQALRAFETQEAILTAADQRILGMSWSEIRANPEIKAFLVALNKSAAPLRGISIVDPDDVLAASSASLPESPIDLSDREYVRQLHSTLSRSVVGRIIITRPQGAQAIPIARRRTTADGSYDGLIASTFSTDYFESFFEHLTAGSGDLISLVREDGYVLAHTPRMSLESRDDNGPLLGRGGIAETRNAVEMKSPIDGKTRYLATRRIGDYPVFIRHGRSLAAVRTQWLTSFAPFGLLCLLAMGLFSIFTWRTSLATRREQEARSRLAVEEANHAADIENADRISRLMDANVFGVVSCSPDGVIEANDAFLKMVELKRADFEDRGFDWKAATGPADVAAEDHAIAEIMKTGACRPYERELMLANGKTVPVLIGATLYERQPLIWICFVLDLTERREREAQQLFVMRELNHRTKNLLTVIRSIAGQIARTGRDWSDFNERFSNRLSALGDSHDLLVESNWRGVSMKDLVHSQFRQYDELTNGQVVTSGEALMLSPRAAQAIGMALYELSTNAVKYGALSKPEGRIGIGWEMFTHAEEGPYFRMHWRESGGPAVVEPSRQGFGHVIIAQMTSRALRGNVVYAFEPKGLEWTLEAPLDSIEEQTDMPFMAKI